MVYRIPSFPSTIGIWRNGTSPPVFPAVTSPAQLNPGRRANVPFIIHPAGAVVPGNMYVLLPRGTDIRDGKSAGGADLVEAPIATGRFYNVAFVDDVGYGFSNEHRFAQLVGIPTWPLPYPAGGPLTSPAVTWLGSGGSLGLPVGSVLCPFAVPVAGLLLICVADYNSAAGAISVSCDGVAQFVGLVSPLAVALGQNAFTAIFAYIVGPGYHPAFVKTIFGLDVLQYQLLFVTGIYTGNFDVGINAIGVGMPALAGSPGQVNANDIFVAQFAQIGSAGPFGFNGGYVSTGGDVNDVIGGVACTFSVGTLFTTIQGLYPVAMPFAFAGAWTGLSDGFQ